MGTRGFKFFLLLEIVDVSKHYPGAAAPALRPFSLTVGSGEVVALAGESGAGKTTLLRLIAGLEQPDTGCVRYRGERVRGPDEQLVPGHPDICLAHQDHRLEQSRTVRDNVSTLLRAYSTQHRQRRTDALLALTHLEPLADRRPRALSGGERQRLALARALAVSPPLLLLDEPFSSLDPLLKDALQRTLVGQLRRQGTTVLMVTHHPADALSLADRVVVTRAGGLCQTGTPQAIYDQPDSAYVARFFGAANLISGAQANRHLLAGERRFPDRARLCLRPEHVRVVPAAAAAFAGQVTDTFFQGAVQEAAVRVAPRLHLRLAAWARRYEIGEWLPLVADHFHRLRR